MQVGDTAPYDALVRLHTAWAKRWTEQLPHGAVVGWILGREDIPARDTLVERRLQKHTALTNGGIDIAQSLDSIGCCLTGSKPGDIAYIALASIFQKATLGIDMAYRISNAEHGIYEHSGHEEKQI